MKSEEKPPMGEIGGRRDDSVLAATVTPDATTAKPTCQTIFSLLLVARMRAARAALLAPRKRDRAYFRAQDDVLQELVHDVAKLLT